MATMASAMIRLQPLPPGAALRPSPLPTPTGGRRVLERLLRAGGPRGTARSPPAGRRPEAGGRAGGGRPEGRSPEIGCPEIGWDAYRARRMRGFLSPAPPGVPYFRVLRPKMADGEYESVLCVKPEVLVYRLPPRASNRGYRAAEWQLDQPAWSGRMRITSQGKVAYVKLEDKTSGELFAQAPVDQFPGLAVEGVTDSSRYFVLRIEDGNGRRAFIGLGFVDRGDAFDFNVALQDHFKWVKQQSELAKQAQNPEQGPKLDLGFKEGQTITLCIASMKKKEGAALGSRSRPAGSGGTSLMIPPPPGGKASPVPLPPEMQAPSCPAPSPAGAQEAAAKVPVAWPEHQTPTAEATADIWGDFTQAPGSASGPAQTTAGWVQF